MLVATTHYSRLILGPEPNPQQAKVFDRIQMHELKADLAVLRFAERRIEKAGNRDDLCDAFTVSLQEDLQTRALPPIEPSRSPWSDRELALLLYGVLKFGEG